VLEIIRLKHCVERRINESPKLTLNFNLNQNGATTNRLDTGYGSPFTARRQAMFKKHTLYALVVVCITVLLFIWMIRDSLCELKIYQENITVLMTLACDVKR
jgi:protein HokA